MKRHELRVGGDVGVGFGLLGRVVDVVVGSAAIAAGAAVVGTVVALVLGAGCSGRDPNLDVGPTAPVVNEPDLSCPGAASCSATLADDQLLVGASKHVITPVHFEIANPAYLKNDRPDSCAPEAPLAPGTERRCGELDDKHLNDCGHDGICPEDDDYTAPDADGSERDGDTNDWFFDCGMDRICPDNVPEPIELRDNGFDDDGDGAVDDGDYPGPDEGEGDGEFQGLWLAGYGNNRPAMGVKDELSVRALVMRQGDTTVAIVTIDAVGVFYDEQLRMKQKLDALKPGEVDTLFIQSTHSHEAPDTLGQWGYIDPFVGLQHGPGRSEEHMENIRTEGAAAVADALDALQPVVVRVGQVHPGIEGLVSDGRDPQIWNDAVTAIAFDSQDTGAPVATVVNWSNHPESLDSRNNFISADYVHAVREGLEKGLPETSTKSLHEGRGGVALYLQGAVGGIMGANSFEITARDGTVYPHDLKTFARTDALGTNIAELAFQALDQSETLATTPLRFSEKSYTAPVENSAFQVGMFNGWFDRELFDFDRDQVIGGKNVPNLKTAAAVIYLGDIGIVTAPGELFPETFIGYDDANSFGRDRIDPENPNPPDLSQAPSAPDLKDRLGSRFAFPMGLCQDEIGYLVPPFDYKLDETAPYINEPEGDHYEETNSIGPQTIPAYLGAIDTLFAFEKARAP